MCRLAEAIPDSAVGTRRYRDRHQVLSLRVALMPVLVRIVRTPRVPPDLRCNEESPGEHGGRPPLGLRAVSTRGGSIEGVAQWLERGCVPEDKVFVEWMLARFEEDRAVRFGNYGSARID
jgi:hypothetical protein